MNVSKGTIRVRLSFDEDEVVLSEIYQQLLAEPDERSRRRLLMRYLCEYALSVRASASQVRSLGSNQSQQVAQESSGTFVDKQVPKEQAPQVPVLSAALESNTHEKTTFSGSSSENPRHKIPEVNRLSLPGFDEHSVKTLV